MNIFIKKLPENLKQDLLNLFNVSWLSAMVPCKWKVGVVVPIPKPDKSKFARVL